MVYVPIILNLNYSFSPKLKSSAANPDFMDSLSDLYNISFRMLDSCMKYGEKAIRVNRLVLWDNPYPERDYQIEITFPEFTCLCPRSGYPDFATIRINYLPGRKIVELKSLKLYLNSFRNSSVSHEEATNMVYSELLRRLNPRFLEVTGDFNPRGNVKTIVRVCSENKKKGKT